MCELRYCSIACYKTHKTLHEADIAAGKIEQSSQLKRDRPGTTQRVRKVDFTGFENHEEFQRLLTRYPLLKIQLQAIYGLTLEPGPNEARSWNRQPLPGFQPASFQHRGGRGRGRGRGDFGRGGAKGGRFGTDSSRDEREHGAWTQAKGDKEALKVMKKMRGEGDEVANVNEGMREFVELCRIRFGDEQKDCV